MPVPLMEGGDAAPKKVCKPTGRLLIVNVRVLLLPEAVPVMKLLPSARELPNASTPELKVVPPEKLLVPESVTVPSVVFNRLLPFKSPKLPLTVPFCKLNTLAMTLPELELVTVPPFTVRPPKKPNVAGTVPVPMAVCDMLTVVADAIPVINVPEGILPSFVICIPTDRPFVLVTVRVELPVVVVTPGALRMMLLSTC